MEFYGKGNVSSLRKRSLSIKWLTESLVVIIGLLGVLWIVNGHVVSLRSPVKGIQCFLKGFFSWLNWVYKGYFEQLNNTLIS